MRKGSVALGTAVLIWATGATTLSLGQVFGPTETRAERKILVLIDRAIRQVERDRSCRRPRDRTTFSDARPSDPLLATLGILRRPQTADERLPDEAYRALPLAGVYREHVRVARSAAGPDFLVIPVRDLDSHTPRPRHCTVELRRRFGRLIRARPPRFKRQARSFLNGVIRADFARPEGKPVEGVWLFDRYRDGLPHSGGAADLTTLRRFGLFGATSDGRSRSTVSVMVPDGVATVTAVYPRIARRGRIQKPRRYPSRVTRSSPVRDNVVAFVVPRDIHDSYPKRFVWRSAGGRVVKVVRNPVF